jgi:hypothetical protein
MTGKRPVAGAAGAGGGGAVLLRCSGEDMERLDALVQRIPMATRSGLAREAMRVGLDVLEEEPARLITGTGRRQPPSRLRDVGPGYSGAAVGRRRDKAARAGARNMTPESSAHKRAAISRSKQRHGDHPFVAAAQARHGSISAWALKNGLKVPTVASWYSRGALRRAIPRLWADRIHAELGVPATPSVWRNGIR